MATVAKIREGAGAAPKVLEMRFCRISRTAHGLSISVDPQSPLVGRRFDFGRIIESERAGAKTFTVILIEQALDAKIGLQINVPPSNPSAGKVTFTRREPFKRSRIAVPHFGREQAIEVRETSELIGGAWQTAVAIEISGSPSKPPIVRPTKPKKTVAKSTAPTVIPAPVAPPKAPPLRSDKVKAIMRGLRQGSFEPDYSERPGTAMPAEPEPEPMGAGHLAAISSAVNLLNEMAGKFPEGVRFHVFQGRLKAEISIG